MDSIKLYSFLTIIIIVTAILFYFSKKQAPGTLQSPKIPTAIVKQQLAKMKEQHLKDPSGVLSKKEYSFEISELENLINTYEKRTDVKKAAETTEEFPVQVFWIKVIFSAIFSIAALFVVLSKKYDEETKKWAFSILSLVAGVWIGTIS